MTEKDFIIQLALSSFNNQYNRNILITDCDAKSILPNQYSTIAYEVFSVRLDDYVRLRMYLDFGTTDNLGRYRLEVDGSEGVGILGDEVYVTTGFIDRYYKESGLYKFNWMGIDTGLWNIFLSESGDELVTEDTGDLFILEGGA